MTDNRRFLHRGECFVSFSTTSDLNRVSLKLLHDPLADSSFSNCLNSDGIFFDLYIEFVPLAHLIATCERDDELVHIDCRISEGLLVSVDFGKTVLPTVAQIITLSVAKRDV